MNGSRSVAVIPDAIAPIYSTFLGVSDPNAGNEP